MGSRYLTDLPEVLRAVGLVVVEYDGWATRARSSGGYDSGQPSVVMVHHTASDASPESDASYMCHGSDSRPLANLQLNRDGSVWVLAAGATNTNGKGGPIGTCPKDSMNTRAIGVEACNDGIGEPWPDIQQDCYLLLVEALTAAYGITQVFSHQEYAPDRKIDVAGPARWPPINSSDTWNMDEFRADLGTDDPSPPEEGTLTDEDLAKIKEVAREAVREVLDEGATPGSSGGPAGYKSAWAETNINQAQDVQELLNRTGGPRA